MVIREQKHWRAEKIIDILKCVAPQELIAVQALLTEQNGGATAEHFLAVVKEKGGLMSEYWETNGVPGDRSAVPPKDAVWGPLDMRVFADSGGCVYWKSGKAKTTKRRSPIAEIRNCLLYTSPSPRDQRGSRMPSSA